MPSRIRCPSCRYSLEGAPGVPSEAHGRFAAEVRCPECGFVLPAGCRVFVGASSPHALVRGRPLLARAWLRFSWGDGAFAAVMFALAALIPAFGAAAARDILATGDVASRIQLAGVVGLWCFSLAWVARSCWRRFGAVGADGRRADETERALVVSGQGVREGGRSLAASTIRRIRVYECMPADDGQVVVALHAGAHPRFGFRQETRPVYAVVRNGTAQRLADELMAVVRGRLEPASEIGDEVSGEAPARDSVPRVMRSLVVAFLPIAALIGLLVDLRLFVDLMLMLFIVVLLAKLNRPGVMTIRFRADAIELSGRFDTWYERQVAVAYPRLQRLDLTQRRGVPQMTLRLRASAESTEIDSDDIKIVPDDLLGMTPKEFAQKFADRLRVPLRCTGSTGGWASS